MSWAGLLPALSLLTGAVIGCHASTRPWPVVLLLPASCVATVLAWRRGRSLVVVGTLAAGMTAAGVTLASDARDRALHTTARGRLDRAFGGFLIESAGPAGPHGPVTARVRLTEDASPRDGFVALRGDLIALELGGGWAPVDGGVLVSVGGSRSAQRQSEWRAGRTIEAPMTFRRPARYLNEGVADAERDQALAGISLLATVKSALLVTVVARGSVFSERSADLRAYVRRAVATWIEPHSATSAGIALAVLIGDRTGLRDDTREKLQAAGTYHVTAISGGNIAILAAAAAFALLVAGLRGRRASLAVLTLLTLYALVINSGPSVWRATVMAIVYLAARAMDHRTAPWQTISVAAAVMVVASPLDVLDPGFVLTFGATIALIEGARAAAGAMARHRLIDWFVASTIASLAVEVALLPVSARLFSRVTAAGLVLNLLAVPLMGLLQIATLLVTVLAGVPRAAAAFGYAAHLSAAALVASADLVAIAPWLAARVPPPGLLLVCIYYLALGAAKAARSHGRALGVCALTAAGAAIVLGLDPTRLASAGPAPGWLRLTMFDVGQGEAMLLETRGSRVLVDAGGSPFGGSDIGSRVLVPALWARGVRTLDTLLVTHGDPDHIGGAPDVLGTLRPGRLAVGITVPAHEPTEELLDAARRLDVPVAVWTAGGAATTDGVRMRVLNPPAPDWERRRVRNDDSVVMEVVYRDVTLLLTGDIGAEVERAIAPRLSRTRTRILKVAHHGSRTSTSRELLESWRPQLALVSAGRGNTFGHPAPEVLDRLRAVGATVLRTDRDGEITLDTDGRRVQWRVFRRQ